jgi:hypothetical protein
MRTMANLHTEEIQLLTKYMGTLCGITNDAQDRITPEDTDLYFKSRTNPILANGYEEISEIVKKKYGVDVIGTLGILRMKIREGGLSSLIEDLEEEIKLVGKTIREIAS